MIGRQIVVLCGAFLSLATGSSALAQVRSEHVSLDHEGLMRARSVSASGPDERIVEAPFAFSAIAVLSNAGSDGQLFVKTSPDGVRWSRAVALPDDEPNEPYDERGRPHRFASDRVSALHFVGGGVSTTLPRFLAFEFRAARNPPSRVAFHFIDAGRTSGREAKRASSDLSPSHPLMPAIVPRVAWGARPPRYAYTLTRAGHLAFHHTAGVSDGLATTTEECAAQVRAIQAFHQDSRGWNDVGYSYLVCGTGEIFQGREDDDDTTDVWGAHDGFNRGSMSVSLLGYFHAPYNQIPTESMMETLVRTFAWMADLRVIDPLDSSLYEAFGAVRPNVYGHREVRPTDCPGDILFARKDEIRARVAAMLATFKNPLPEAAR